MLFRGEFVPGIDLVDVCLWLFVIFFIGLIAYLQREATRAAELMQQQGEL